MKAAVPALLLSLSLAGVPVASASEISQADVVLEVLVPTLPDEVPAAAPARFVLMEDGTIYVGGTRSLMAGRLEGGELKALERRISDVRKLPLTGVMNLGPGGERRRLVLKKGRAIDMVLNGDPAAAPARLRPLAALVEDLAAFAHASLRPYEPVSFAMSAREGTLPGGCRPWTMPEPLADSVFAPRVVPARGHGDWPTGAVPASVC
ncbi:MAG TPA: hypothetical protein VMR21_13165, partial [Vicinamibacteria bacterium]|nr:hypothetical protein [Vicinamibacteria bacterium]